MTQNTKPISPLRRRMLEDMTLRKLSPKAQATYIRAVINFTPCNQYSHFRPTLVLRE